jgi:hypothetical protein
MEQIHDLVPLRQSFWRLFGMLEWPIGKVNEIGNWKMGLEGGGDLFYVRGRTCLYFSNLLTLIQMIQLQQSLIQ